MDDNACWLAYEFMDARNCRPLGGAASPFFPPNVAIWWVKMAMRVTPPRRPICTWRRRWKRAAMMGTSNRFTAAPDYYFCSNFWLLGNATLGNGSTWCEHHAWYSDRWGGGASAIVRALRAEPKAVRRWQEDVPVGACTVVYGTILHAGDRRTLILEKGGIEVARVTLDANSRYVIPDLLPGNYTLRVEGTAIEQPVSLTPGQ